MKKWNDFQGKDLTFVVCAYKECPYLEESIRALLAQTVSAKILISTSTPNEFIKNIADKYKIELRINPDKGQIKDYNFAMKQAETQLVMLAHQDEILHKTFVENVLNGLNYSKDPIIAFTNYIEMHNNIIDKKASMLVRIKRIMLIPMKFKFLSSSKLGKTIIQCFGDPITHPSVVCVAKKMPQTIFREEYSAAMDWDLWQRLIKQKGSFVYIDKILLYHRMNEDNQTNHLLRTSNERYENEYAILCRMWPKAVAKFILYFYQKAIKYY